MLYQPKTKNSYGKIVSMAFKKFVGEQAVSGTLYLAQNRPWFVGNYTLTGETAAGCYGIFDGCGPFFFKAPKEVNPLAKGLYIGGGLLETAGGTCLVTNSLRCYRVLSSNRLRYRCHWQGL